MKSALKIDTDDIVRIEEIQCSTGIMPSDTSTTPSAINKAIIIDVDYRRSLALGSLGRNEYPLSYARALIQRGNLAEAKAFLAQLISQERSDSRSLSLIRFEQTRISFFESDWLETIRLGSESKNLNPPAVTYLALSQLLANAYFELGRFSESNLELEKVDELSVLYPFAASSLYAKMLNVRLIAREIGAETAQRRLDQILKDRVLSSRVDNDLLFSYLRAQMDIRRTAGRSGLMEAVGCYILSVAAGDKLYAALALLDIFCEFGQTPPESVGTRLIKFVGEFLRVRALYEEIEGIKLPTTTGKTLRQHRALSFVNSQHPLLNHDLLERILNEQQGVALIFLPAQNLFVSAVPFTVSVFLKEKQISLVLSFLSKGGGTKEQFFKAVWGTQKYTSRLHDNHIAVLLHRARNDYKIPVKIKDGMVVCDQIVLEIK